MSDSDTLPASQSVPAERRPPFWPVFWAAFLGVRAALLTCWGAAAIAGLARPDLYGTPYRSDSRADSSGVDVISGLCGALDLYRAHIGAYPRTEDGGLQLLLRPPPDPNLARLWQGPYVRSERQLKDAWDRPYNYRCPGEHRPESYDLWSTGPVVGPEDDIENW